MDTVTFILTIVLAIPLWCLYHKLFVVYYKNVTRGIIGEIAGAIFTSYLLVNLAGKLLGAIGGGLFSLLSIVLRTVSPILALWLWASLIRHLRQKKRGAAAEEPKGLAKALDATWSKLARLGAGNLLVYFVVTCFGVMAAMSWLGLS